MHGQIKWSIRYVHVDTYLVLKCIQAKKSKRIPWLIRYYKTPVTVASVFTFHLESHLESGLIKYPNISVMFSIEYCDPFLTL